MRDPNTVAFDIYLGPKIKKDKTYRSPFITIWHVDPAKHGDDDSCGWFIKLHHGNESVYEKIVKEFESEWDSTFTGDNGVVYNCGWFTPNGETVLSVQGIVFNMYLYASKIVLNPDDKISPGKAWDKAWHFMNKYKSQITYFAENNRDSLRNVIVRKFENGCNVKYTSKQRSEFIRNCAKIVYIDILAKLRPWYKHPRWHIHHWRIQFHPFLNLKRRYWTKCVICGKRGFKTAPISDWSGKRKWHQECDNSNKPTN